MDTTNKGTGTIVARMAPDDDETKDRNDPLKQNKNKFLV